MRIHGHAFIYKNKNILEKMIPYVGFRCNDTACTHPHISYIHIVLLLSVKKSCESCNILLLYLLACTCVYHIYSWCLAYLLQVFREARRNAPSVLYLPLVASWWGVAADTVRATFLSCLLSLPPSSPVLLLATAECPWTELHHTLRDVFCEVCV